VIVAADQVTRNDFYYRHSVPPVAGSLHGWAPVARGVIDLIVVQTRYSAGAASTKGSAFMHPDDADEML
jgi:hypothetical protein